MGAAVRHARTAEISVDIYRVWVFDITRMPLGS